MADTITYAERWSDLAGGPVDELDEDDARRRHEAGELYVAVLRDDDGALRAYLEIRLEKGYVAVHFLDDEGRNHVTYVFGRDDGDDRMFLQRATWREFGEDGEVARGESFVFKRDGMVYVESKDYVTREAARGEKQDDVSSNWEPVPAFGDYDSIARLER